MNRSCGAMVLVAALVALPAAGVKQKAPGGLVAVSAGESVILVDPVTGSTNSIPAGPVAWLFPAPGGMLFAPDLVHGTTTVLDLRTQVALDTMDGITMPHFGTLTDRYLVVADQLLVISYPERALMNRFDIGFDHPWQVEVAAENTVVFVLERDPAGDGHSALVAVNLGDGRFVYRQPLGGDVRHFSLSPALGVVALADGSGGRVVLADPATLTHRAAYEVSGSPVDLVFVDGGSTLVAAVALTSGAGELVLWKIRADKKHGLVVKKQWQIPLGGEPVRMAASPDRRHVAVGTVEGRFQIVDLETREVVHDVDMKAEPRDIVWCDPSTPGPMLPEWSDDDPPRLDLGG